MTYYHCRTKEPKSIIFIDDLEVKVQDYETKYKTENKILNRFWQTLFIEDFEGYESENDLKKSGGWAGLQRPRGVDEAIYPVDYSGRVSLLMKAYQEARAEKPIKRVRSILQPGSFEASSGLKSIKLSTTKAPDTEAMRIFSLPEGLPFAISQRSFKVVDRLGISQSIKDKIRTKRDESKLRDYFDSGSGALGEYYG